jgi:CheY-like chemotaxis protein
MHDPVYEAQTDPEETGDEATPPLRLSDQVRLELDILGADAGRPEGRPTRKPAGAPPLTILVVDDDADMRVYVKRCLRALKRQPVRVIEAADGVEALAKARAGGVDLIVSDLVMPRLDGLALCRALQADAPARPIPVLLITGEASVEAVWARAGDVQVGAVLAKPFNARKLCAGVDRLLARPARD